MLFGHTAGPRRLSRALHLFSIATSELRKAAEHCRNSMGQLKAEIAGKQELHDQLAANADHADAAADNIQKLVQPPVK